MAEAVALLKCGAENRIRGWSKRLRKWPNKFVALCAAEMDPVVIVKLGRKPSGNWQTVLRGPLTDFIQSNQLSLAGGSPLDASRTSMWAAGYSRKEKHHV